MTQPDETLSPALDQGRMPMPASGSVTRPRSQFDFRTELETVHRSDRLDPGANPRPGEIVIDSTWLVTVGEQSSPEVQRIADDLADYFAVSMNLNVVVAPDIHDQHHSITLAVDQRIPDLQGRSDRSYLIKVSEDRVIIIGRDVRAVAQGAYFLEDLINLRRAPYLNPMSQVRSPIFSPRMTHSGWGLDGYPDGYLNQIAHAGIDSILLFAAGPDLSPDATTHRNPRGSVTSGRHQSFAALADRAAKYGLDLYLYAYVHSGAVHPRDSGARAHYAATYGSLVAACPKARGIVLVGESVEFPSRDHRTTGRLRSMPSPDGLPDDRPSPGWWPCNDYPEWLDLVADVCREHNPDLEVVFWTYNWGWAPETDRVEMLRKVRSDVTVQATFEMFEQINHDGVTNVCVDYTAAATGPGRYFTSEAEVVHDRDMRLFAMANTGGLTWDFGVIPYQPIPQQWARRHHALIDAHDRYGLSGLMECHHYGWWPSFISDLAKASFWSPSEDADIAIMRLAERDFGRGAAKAVRAWHSWSEAAQHYIPTNADQYGPFRIGPAYPLTLFANPQLMIDSDAMFGDLIVKIPYDPDQINSVDATPNSLRIHAELESLGRMLHLWRAGSRELEAARSLAPAYRQPAAGRLEGLARFVGQCIQTTINTKAWWLKKAQLLASTNPGEALQLADELAAIGHTERDNAKQAIACTDADSRLGWEPSMGYVGDSAHIRWKLAHLDHVLGVELPDYRRRLAVAANREGM